MNEKTENNLSQTNKQVQQEEVPNSAVTDMSAWASFLPIILMFGIFYLFLIKPQEKRRKEHEEMIKNLKVGDSVVTAGGMQGTISSIDGASVEIDVGSGIKIKFLKSAILEIPTKS